MTIDAQVLEVVARAQQHIDKIRAADNEEDMDASRAAHVTFAELFALGMTDRWLADAGEDMPSPEDWEWEAEALSPDPSWGEEATARFHKACGDLSFLHSNDAGLNAAKDNYESAIEPLRQLDSVAAIQCLSRLLRAAAYASYGDDIFEEHQDALVWADRVARELDPSVRDEFQLSLIEIAHRLLGADTASLATPDDRCGWLGTMLRQDLLELCQRADELPYRRAVPWLALSTWAKSDLFASEPLQPFHDLFGTATADQLVLAALDKAEALEDGLFYSHGGALTPSQYVSGTAKQIAHTRLMELTEQKEFRKALEVVQAHVSTLEDYEQQERLSMERTRLILLDELGETEAALTCAGQLVTILESMVDRYSWDSELLDELRQRAESADAEDLIAHIARVEEARAKATANRGY